MLKKSLLLGIVLTFCAGLLFAQTAEAPSVGNGSSDNPYQIASIANLRWLSEKTDRWASGIYFIQTADIDASVTQGWNDGAGFSPIGNNASDYFYGNYNGNGHTISGLYINRPSSDYQGLFGYFFKELLGSGAELSNLGLVDATITGTNYVGGLIGNNSGGTVSNCYTTGTVSGTGERVGGLIGHNEGWGAVVSNCYASGSASGTGERVGGFLGNYYYGTITACFWDQTVNSGLNGVGDGYSGNQIIGNMTAEMKMKSTYTNFGWDFLTIWGINDTSNEGYPYLYWQSLPGIIIHSIEEITSNSINIYADLFYLGFSYPYEHGFCWNTEGEPSLEDSIIALGPVDSTGVFGAEITGLASNTLYYIRAYATNEAGTRYSEVISFTTLETGIAEGIPLSYALSQNYPNPFNPQTTLQYGLPEAADVNLMIFDISGRKIKEWSIGSQQAGWHEVIWDGTDQSGSFVSTGVYIYCLRAGDFVDTKKMVFMK